MKGGFGIPELDNDNIHGRENGIRHYYRIANEAAHEHLLGSGYGSISQVEESGEGNLPLRSITHGENKLAADEKDAGKAENNEYVQPDMMSERVQLWI